ncbi:MAG: hypothetical protein K2G51_07775, partial [Lachnospiraceae bacterium]|nr:hypothetical protein [Lachnospiraceae bacterium]
MSEDSQKKSYADFLKEMVRKKYGEFTLSNSDNSDTDNSAVRNLKRDLKKLLEGLGDEGVLKNELYMQGNKKFFPEYILAFFEVLLFLPSGKKDTLGSKIKNKRFLEITEAEIAYFTGKMRESFQAYGKSIVVEGLESSRKKELDNMIDEAENLDEVENDWNNDVEEKYVYRRWELLSKAEMYAEEAKKVLENKKKIMQAEKRMGTMVQQRIKELLHLPEILDRKIDFLTNYRSDVDELRDIKFTMPLNYVTDIQKAEKFQQYYFTSGEKLFLLEQFEMCLKMFLTDWEELLEIYK